ncbi:hypothetical protein LPW11_09805 [Geomonas sp. RF6]|uniref:hypothetical protein n=1 Tax=Geomonas sp. RF6 TaxID=2897342 RepID=UPI001E528F9F|nr:hypothetical protein [Geomonas sp. RF6]UFS72469.1 hypothetical protein LPW11_09805 [Geomonas sp. RF6]
MNHPRQVGIVGDHAHIEGGVHFHDHGQRSTCFHWPDAWDFSAFISEKRQNFTGRDWLFKEIDDWLAQPTPRTLLLRGDFGVGKSAFLAELIARKTDAVIGWHFCQHDTQETLKPTTLVNSLAAQFKTTLPAFGALIDSDDSLQRRLEKTAEDPASAFESAVINPLARIEAPDGPRLVLIDALDEGLELDGAEMRRHGTIVQLLANKAMRFPRWLRIIVTSRNNPDVVGRLGKFGIKDVNAENVSNEADLRAFILQRLSRQPLESHLRREHCSCESAAALLLQKSLGKFLYAVRALDQLEDARIGLAELASLPPGMDSFYLDSFDRRFARVGRDYSDARDVLGLLAVAKEPLPSSVLAEILARPEQEILSVRRCLPDFIKLRAGAWAFDHFSLSEWLTGTTEDGFARAGDYSVNIGVSNEHFRKWALRTVKKGAAHESAYLVRHLSSHVPDGAECRRVFTHLMLSSFEWLAARLRLTGIHTLIADCDQLGESSDAKMLRAVLRCSMHVLRRVPEQLPAQVLGRLRSLLQPSDSIAALIKSTEYWVEHPPDLTTSSLLVPTGGSLRFSTNCLAAFSGHERAVNCVAVLRDGRIASSGDDYTVRVWDPQGIEDPLLFEGHTERLAVLPDGRIASLGWDNVVQVWDPQGIQEPLLFEGHTDEVKSLSLPDGRIASFCLDGAVRVWDPRGIQAPLVFDGDGEYGYMAVLPDGRVVTGRRVWDPHTSESMEFLEADVTSLVVLPDGRFATAVRRDNSVRVWDFEAIEEPLLFEGHTAPVTSLAVLPDGRLVSSSLDTTVRVWDPRGIQEPLLFEGDGYYMAVLPDGRVISTCCNGSLRVWDPQGIQESFLLEGHTHVVNCLALLPDGRLASGSWDKTVRVWDPQGGEAPLVCEGHTRAIRFLGRLPDGRVASGSDDGTVRVWDPQENKESSLFVGHTSLGSSHTVLPDGRIASSANDNTALVWDPKGVQESLILEGHTEWITSLAVFPDGRIVSGGLDRTLRIWDSLGIQEQVLCEGHSFSVGCLAVLADGRIASADGNTVRVFDPEGIQDTMVFEGHTYLIDSLAVLPDGRIASSGSEDKTVRVWDPWGNKEPTVFERHTSTVCCFAALPDGRIATGGEDGTLWVWDPQGIQDAMLLEGHRGSVQCLAVLPGGRIASGGSDDTARVWDLRSGQQLAQFKSDAMIMTLLTLPDGILVAGDFAGMVHFLKLY